MAMASSALIPARRSTHLRGFGPRVGSPDRPTGPFRLRLQKTSSVFGALAEAIVYQQLTGKAAATIFARVCALFPHTTDGLVARRVLRATGRKASRGWFVAREGACAA